MLAVRGAPTDLVSTRKPTSCGSANAVSYPRLRGRGSALPVIPVRMHLSSDDSDLSAVEAVLAQLDDSELCALIDSTNNVTQLVRSLLTWIGHACDWELHRRAGVDFPLLSPLATIPPEEDAVSIAAMLTVRERFEQGCGRDAGGVVALFDAILRVLTGGERRH
jgi:hypothetical protein